MTIERTYRKVQQLIYFGGDGIGDELLLSTAVHELRARGEANLGVMTTFPEFFEHSPDVDYIFPVRHDHAAALPGTGRKVRRLVYIHRRLAPDIDIAPPIHLLAEMCRLADVTGPVMLRPYLFLTDAERCAAARPRQYVAIQTSRRSASLKIGNKEWFTDRFQTVADALSPDYDVIQLGLPSDPPLRGAEDLRGKTTLRQSAAVLAGASAFVGLVGMLMHLARAVDCPAVIIFGGRERPDQSGYSANANLYTPLPCAPCWRWNSCDHGRRCMQEISSMQVVAATRALLASAPARPLRADVVALSA